MKKDRMKNIQTALSEHIYPILPPHIARLIAALPGSLLHKLTEIRIRANQPLQLVLGNQDITVKQSIPHRCINAPAKMFIEHSSYYAKTRFMLLKKKSGRDI